MLNCYLHPATLGLIQALHNSKQLHPSLLLQANAVLLGGKKSLAGFLRKARDLIAFLFMSMALDVSAMDMNRGQYAIDADRQIVTMRSYWSSRRTMSSSPKYVPH